MTDDMKPAERCGVPRRRRHSMALPAMMLLAAAGFFAGAGAAQAETYNFTELSDSQAGDVSDDSSGEYASAVMAFSASKIESSEKEDDGESSSDSKESDGKTSTGQSYTFTQLNANKDDAVSDQLSMSVKDSGKSTVAFTFYNDVGQKSSITDIYLTGTGGLLTLPGKITEQSSGVSYSTGATPPNLPVGEKYDFYATVGADSNPPVTQNGVNTANEYVTWTFALASGASYQDVIKAIDSGTLRVGLFVPGSSGGSSSFINSCGMGASCGPAPGPVPSIPLPASLWLMFGALGGLACLSRRGARRSRLAFAGTARAPRLAMA